MEDDCVMTVDEYLRDHMDDVLRLFAECRGDDNRSMEVEHAIGGLHSFRFRACPSCHRLHTGNTTRKWRCPCGRPDDEQDNWKEVPGSWLLIPSKKIEPIWRMIA